MRREIEVQTSLLSPNIMPILEHDDEHTWFTMPIASRSMWSLTSPLDNVILERIVRDISAGLRIAHSRNVLHRDIKPHNILLVGEPWVLADWGVVRRPLGETTAQHTQQGNVVGTLGFAAPEALTNAHDLTPRADVYGLGRVIAWAATGTLPNASSPLDAPPPWRTLVRTATAIETSRRPESITHFIQMLDIALLPDAAPPVDRALIDRAKKGDAAAGLIVLARAHEFADDADFFIDDLVPITGAAMRAFVSESPHELTELLTLLDTHVTGMRWTGRNFDYANDILRWFHLVAEYALADGHLVLAEDAVGCLFRYEPNFDRYRQKTRTVTWLSGLSGDHARLIAQVLVNHPQAQAYYGPLTGPVDPRIKQLTNATRQD